MVRIFYESVFRCARYESMGLNCHLDQNFMENLLPFFMSSKSLQLNATIKTAYFIRSLISLFLNVCCCELSCAATMQCTNVNKSPKMIYLLAKIVFISKVLDSQINDLQRFRRYKESQKISHEILIKLPYESVLFTDLTTLLMAVCSVVHSNPSWLVWDRN
jgi:hypothetical protein